jgi:CHAD domain-containing protein
MSDLEFAGTPTDSTLSAGDVLREAIAADAARLIAHEPIARRGEDPEGVHQARVATRRLRSHLATFAPILKDGPTSRLSKALRRLGRSLGTVRDLDVLHARFRKGIETFEPMVRDDGLALLEVLTRQGIDAATTLRRELSTKRHQSMLAALAGFVALPPFRSSAGLPAETFLAEAVGRRLTTLGTDIAALGLSPTDTQLHDARILAKPARYVAEVSSVALGPTCGRLAKRLAELCDDFGTLSDGSGACLWLDAFGEDPSLAFAVALLRAREIDRMQAPREDWRGRWERVQGAAMDAPWLAPAP